MKKGAAIMIGVLTWWMVHPSPALAVGEPMDSAAFRQLYRQYFDYYNAPDKEQEFYKCSEQLQNILLQQGEKEKHYLIRMNETLYDTDHNHPYTAIKKANKMLEDMKADDYHRYDMVYNALGTIFESRGNYRMAEYYFRQGINSCGAGDTTALVGIYSRLAFLKMLRNPAEAEVWNRKNGQLCGQQPATRQIYLFLEAMIHFSANHRQGFHKAYADYHAFREQHPDLDNFGTSAIEVANKAMQGHCQEALQMLGEAGGELDLVSRQDMRIRICNMMGNKEQALKASLKLTEIVDSLNSNMLFDNLNSINAEMNMGKLRRAAAEQKMRLLTVIIALALVVIAVLAVWLFVRNKMRKHLVEKNGQLKSALKMAEESDHMKTEFIRQVSHEMRTPLNAIVGFNEILHESHMQLAPEEQRDMVERIKLNTKAITNIVDELLLMSDKESSNYYQKTDDIQCNKLFPDLLYRNRDGLSSDIELKYTTEVLNRFTFRSNEAGVSKILDNLIQNSIKFTTRGFINLHCRLSQDDRVVEISVTDTGRGIDKENRSRIFEQFFKTDHFKEGIGLGLTVSRKIAQKLGGSLTLDEGYTTGTRFVLTLPAG